MVISAQPDPLLCASDAQVVPNVLHLVWYSKHGNGCPPVQALVSMITAALHLQPDYIVYWVDVADESATWPSPNCSVPRHGDFLRIGERLGRCFRELPVTVRRIDWRNRTAPIVKATETFKVAQQLHRRTLRPSSVSDIVREFALLTEGGWYMDADAFVLSREMAQFRRCQHVLGSDVMDAPASGEYYTIGGPAEARAWMWPGKTTADISRAVVRANNGFLFAAANSTFGRTHFEFYRNATFISWFFSCCNWPFFYHRNETHHADLLISPSLRTLGRRDDYLAFGLNGSKAWNARDWAAFVPQLAKRGALGLHLTDFPSRLANGQALPVVAAILEHALSTAAPAARRRHQMHPCIDLAKEWLDAMIVA